MASMADAAVNLKLLSASALLEEDPSAAARAAREILKVYPDSSAAALLHHPNCGKPWRAARPPPSCPGKP